LVRANAEGAPHITGADFPSSGGDLVTALAKKRGFPFLGVKKKIAVRVQAARNEGAGLFVLQSIMALVMMGFATRSGFRIHTLAVGEGKPCTRPHGKRNFILLFRLIGWEYSCSFARRFCC
jgi:hypothetical protein